MGGNTHWNIERYKATDGLKQEIMYYQLIDRLQMVKWGNMLSITDSM